MADLQYTLKLIDRLDRRITTGWGCWTFRGYHNAKGYAQTSLHSVPKAVHIVTYELVVGPVPDGLVLDHIVCDNPSCVNPFHLIPSTNKDNILRGNCVSAVNARKEKCKYGHPLDYKRPDGGRGCKVCRQAAKVRHREKKRNA